MPEKGKHIYTKDQLLKLLMEEERLPGDLDDFDREALEGLKLVNDEGLLDKLNEEVDSIVEREKRKKRTLYYFSAAASLILLIGLVFFFKTAFIANDNKPLALAEKTKEENVHPPSKSEEAPKVQTAKEYKELEQGAKNIPESKTSADTKASHLGETAQKDNAPEQSKSINTKNGALAQSQGKADETETLTDETKPMLAKDMNMGGAGNQTPLENRKQTETTENKEETKATNDDANLTAVAREKSEQSITVNANQPTQAAFSQEASGPVNQHAAGEVKKQKSKKEDNAFYANEADKNTQAKKFREPAFIDGDSAFAGYTRQHLKISSPGYSGLVVVSFLVTKEGKAEQIEVIKPLANCPLCSEDVINLIKSVKKWQPALMENEIIAAPKKISIQYN